MSAGHKLPACQRLEQIRTTLHDQQSVSISTLAERFGVSEMTIRRDLDKLQREGQVKRTHGGAMPAERMAFEFDFVARRKANRKAKQAIAREAVKLIKPGHRIILDTGTTTLELAHLLKDWEGLTVITPSLAVASVLQFSEGIQTVLLGGVIRRGSPDLTGSLTEIVLDMFAVDIAFQGADGIALDGSMYTEDMRISRVDQKIRKRADRTYILAASSKIDRTALVRHGSLQQTEALITDDGLQAEHRKQLEKHGINLMVVSTKD